MLLTGLSDRIFARKHDILRHHRTRHSLRASPLWALGFGGRLRSIWNWIDGVESCHWLGPSGSRKPKWNKGEYSTEQAPFYDVAWILPLISIWPPARVSQNLVDRLCVSEYGYPWTRGYLFSNQEFANKFRFSKWGLPYVTSAEEGEGFKKNQNCKPINC